MNNNRLKSTIVLCTSIAVILLVACWYFFYRAAKNNLEIAETRDAGKMESIPTHQMSNEGVITPFVKNPIPTSPDIPKQVDTELDDAIEKELNFLLNLKIGMTRKDVLRDRPDLMSEGQIGLSSDSDGGNMWRNFKETGPPLNLTSFVTYRFDSDDLSHANSSFIGKREKIRRVRDRLIHQYKDRYGAYKCLIARELTQNGSMLSPMLVWRSEKATICIRQTLDMSDKYPGDEGLSVIMEATFLEQGDIGLNKAAGREFRSFFEGEDVSREEKFATYQAAGLELVE